MKEENEIPVAAVVNNQGTIVVTNKYGSPIGGINPGGKVISGPYISGEYVSAVVDNGINCSNRTWTIQGAQVGSCFVGESIEYAKKIKNNSSTNIPNNTGYTPDNSLDESLKHLKESYEQAFLKGVYKPTNNTDSQSYNIPHIKTSIEREMDYYRFRNTFRSPRTQKQTSKNNNSTISKQSKKTLYKNGELGSQIKETVLKVLWPLHFLNILCIFAHTLNGFTLTEEVTKSSYIGLIFYTFICIVVTKSFKRTYCFFLILNIISFLLYLAK